MTVFPDQREPAPLPGVSGLDRVERTTRREQILATLRDAVSSGQLPPGMHVGEVELSAALGVSRGTLREALRHLQQEGLLVPDARGRLSVRTVNEREVHEIFSVRAALEALAGEEVCRVDARDGVVVELRGRLALMDRPGAALAELITTDLAFHEVLCRASGNVTLHQTWSSLSGLARAAITAAGPRTALANMSVARHAPLVELVGDGDAEGLREFLTRHMAEAAEQIIEHMRDRSTS